MEFTDLLEPGKLYRNQIKSAHHENVEAEFDRLVQESKIDIAANKETVKKVNLTKVKLANVNKTLRKKKALGGFLVGFGTILLVASVVAIILSFVLKNDTNTLIIAIVAAVISAIIGITLLFLRAKLIKPSVKKVEEELKQTEYTLNQLIQEGTNQMRLLYSLIDWNIPSQLFTKTIPLIKMDQYFDKNKFQYMNEHYGFTENNEPNISSVYVQSGSILGNPFIVEKNYVQDMENYTYTGTKTIHWTTTEYDGKTTRTVHHTQTLTATVVKPRPYYFYDTWLVYSNDAASKLNFSRKPSRANSMNEKEIAKFVKSWDKKFDKQNEKDRKSGKTTIIEMGNEEFEALFDATNRDNDIEFRLLFTPLAQKSMLDLIKTKEPFGDDFNFIKRGPLNYIKSLHSQIFDLDGDPSKFAGYSYEDIKANFIQYCDDYMKNFYFDLAPLLAIPLYQQNMTFEYIYEGEFATNLSSFETEIMANQYNQNLFIHPESDTPAILKRTSAYKNGKVDNVQITAHSFKKIPHVEYVTKLGGDGNFHEIPVEWFEYAPLEKTTDFSVQECHESTNDFVLKADTINNSIVEKFGKQNTMLFRKGIFSFLNASNGSYNGEELNNIFAKKEN